MDLGIAGRRAIVCGGSKGLGRGCAVALAREGVHVWLVARSREALVQAAREITRETGAAVETVSADVAAPEGRAAILDACASADILIHNAGGRPQTAGRRAARAHARADSRAALRHAGRVRRGVRVPVQRAGRLHHGPESAARRRAVSGAALKLPDDAARAIADPRSYADWDRL